MDGTGSLMATTDGRGTRVRVRGRLDDADAGRLRALLEDAAPPAVRVDLSRAGTLPPAVLRVLAGAHRARVEGAAGLVLEQPSRAATRSLRVSGLDRVLAVELRPGRAARPAAAGRPA